VRQWEFWRKGFWTRPVLMLLYAALLLPLGLALAGAGVGALGAGEALDAERFCASDRTEECLERVAGVLDGPHYQRGPGDEWWVRPHAGGEVLDEDVDGRYRDTLEEYAGGTVTGLVHEGDLVAIDLADGTRVETRAAGVRGALFFAAMSLLCLAGALMVFASGWATGRKLGWLSTRLADRGDSKVARVAFVGGCVLFAPLLFAGLPLWFGAPMWVIVAALALMLACGALVVVRRASR